MNFEGVKFNSIWVLTINKRQTCPLSLTGVENYSEHPFYY